MKRYLFIGSVEYSALCLKALLKMKCNIVSIMCPEQGISSFNSDYSDIGVIAREHKKDIRYFRRIKDEADYIRKCHPDIIFVLGLSQIIPEEILKIPVIGCIGSHPALLPHNRGRHPIIWAIANGLRKSGITLFWLDSGIDSGDIWVQEEFTIDINDTATSIYQKVIGLTVDILMKKVPELEKERVVRIPQDNSCANYLRKRVKKDGEIDWRMSSKRIDGLVRALAKPYPGAHCVFGLNKIKIWKTEIIDDCKKFTNIEPGKTIDVKNDGIVVKTGDGLIKLVEHEFKCLPKTGDYLL